MTIREKLKKSREVVGLIKEFVRVAEDESSASCDFLTKKILEGGFTPKEAVVDLLSDINWRILSDIKEVRLASSIMSRLMKQIDEKSGEDQIEELKKAAAGTATSDEKYYEELRNNAEITEIANRNLILSTIKDEPLTTISKLSAQRYVIQRIMDKVIPLNERAELVRNPFPEDIGTYLSLVQEYRRIVDNEQDLISRINLDRWNDYTSGNR